MILDVVESRGKPLIYAQQRRQPRLAIFGRHMLCRPPAIFPGLRNDGRRHLTQLSAEKGARALTLIYHNKRNDSISPPIAAPLGLPELVRFLADTPRKPGSGEPFGFAVPYSEVLDIVSTFCETGTLSAELVVEKIGRIEDDGIERGETEFD